MGDPEFRFGEPQPPFDWGLLRAAHDYIHDELRRITEQQMRQDVDAVNEMVERMLVYPEPVGIVEVCEEKTEGSIYEGNYRTAFYRHYKLSEHVPFGNIVRFRSMEEYRAWEANGHPILDPLPKMLTDDYDGPGVD